jgi:hypothetical protein
LVGGCGIGSPKAFPTPSAKMPSYRRSIRSREREQSLNQGERSQRLPRSMPKLPEMPDSRSRGSRSGVRLSIGRKRRRERRSESGTNRQLQKPKELLRTPVGNTKPRSKRLKMPTPRLINDTRLKTLVGKSRKRNLGRDCAGLTISHYRAIPGIANLKGLGGALGLGTTPPYALSAHFLLLRWPSEIPSAKAFCLKAPGVRFSALETLFTGVLPFECFFSSRTSSRVQSRRITRLALATAILPSDYKNKTTAQLRQPELRDPRVDKLFHAGDVRNKTCKLALGPRRA